jgi:uncharacterized membrane protein YjjP (DUF1212 family)
MMKSGGGNLQGEDTVTRICKACKIPYVEVFATPTGIFLSMTRVRKTVKCTLYQKDKGGGIDLEKISRINHFSREFTTPPFPWTKGLQY